MDQPLKWKIFKKISLGGELFVVKMLGPGGASMNHKTFGNMIHPDIDFVIVLRDLFDFLTFGEFGTPYSLSW